MQDLLGGHRTIRLVMLLTTLCVGDRLWSSQAPREPDGPVPSAPIAVALQEVEALLENGEDQKAYNRIALATATARARHDLPGEARSLHLIGRVFVRRAQIDAAMQALVDEAAVWESGGYGPERIATLFELGNLMAGAGKPSEPGVLTEAIGVARRETVRPNTAIDMLRLNAQDNLTRKRLEIASRLAEAAVEIRRRKFSHSLELVEDLFVSASVAEARGDPDTAERHYREALELRRVLTPKSLELVGTAETLAQLLSDRGEIDGAEKLYIEASDVARSIEAGSRVYAAELVNLANVLIRRGEIARAEALIDEALNLPSVPADDPLRDAALNNLGAALLGHGDLEAAADVLNRALGIRRARDPTSPEVASTQENLGGVAMAGGDLAEAVRWYEAALRIRVRTDPDSLKTAQTLNNIGVALFRQDKTDASLGPFTRALKLKERLAPNSLSVAATLSNLGEVAREQHDLDSAERYHILARDIRQRLAPGSLAMANSLTNLSRLAFQRGHFGSAEAFALGGWRVARELRRGVSGDQSTQALQIAVAGYGEALIDMQVSNSHWDAAFETLEDMRAGALRQSIVEARTASGTTAAGAGAYRKAADQMAAIEAAVDDTNRTFAAAEERLRIDGVNRAPEEQVAVETAEVARLKVALERAQSDYSFARLEVQQRWHALMSEIPSAATRTMDARRVSESVPLGVLYVAFASTERATYVFAVRRGRPIVVGTVGVAPGPLADRILAHHKLVSRSDTSVPEIERSGRELFQALFPAAIAHQVAVANRLWLAPDGPLWDLPFSTLGTGRIDARFLGQWKPLTVIPSLSSLEIMRANVTRTADASALVVGNPRFSYASDEVSGAADRGTRLWTSATGRPPVPLPASAEEAAAVARVYGVSALIQGDATEAAVRDRLARARVVHLATHGFAAGTRGQDGGVLLGIPPAHSRKDSNDDGILEAWEILRLSIAADLVVLSACETARGERVDGEGVVGLARAFQIAGAKGVIASQWLVSDVGTAQLMARFHESVRAGVPADASLHAAITAVGNGQWAHPYYWGAFEFFGDARPLTGWHP